MQLNSDPREEKTHELRTTPAADANRAAEAAGQASHGWALKGEGGDAGENRRGLIAGEDRHHLRRWAISAVIVLLAHGAIVAGVITWRKTMVAPAGFPRPIEIELAPAPRAPATQQTDLPPVPERLDRPVEKVEEKTEEKSAAEGERRGPAKSVEQPAGAVPPAIPVPPESAEGERAVDLEKVTGGGAPGARPAGASGASPIDTRIAEPRRGHFKSDIKFGDWKRSVIARPSKNFGERQPAPYPGATGDMARNAIGSLRQDRAAGASAKALSATDGAKNAVGSSAMNILAGAASNGLNGTATNAIGVAVPVRASTAGPNLGQPIIAPVASAGTRLSDGAINGTSMIRRGTGPAAVGGPAKNGAGVINGTLIRLRYP